ncbi:hypothetical protein [Allohahella marinimesophila]|uniref:N-acetyltransferase domain-containing protein n=1 Tax=Allohahella marinimesophila TaxID=1054972 RepID=A0ABP7P0H3_9GAMM
MNNASSTGINARYVAMKKITIADIQHMYSVFQRYYDNTDLNTFLEDISQKSGVILVRANDDNRVVGFSTVATLEVTFGNRRGTGIFSGDTIIEREFWGSRALQSCFARYMLLEKLRSPHKPVFWLLISKGYKTYLLLANNFRRYYPNLDNHDAELEKVTDSYCEALFPGKRDDSGLLKFGENAQCLRDDVAEISDELRQKHPKIGFFEARNPTWNVGTELPCVGVVCMRTLSAYALKAFRSPVTSAAVSRLPPAVPLTRSTTHAPSAPPNLTRIASSNTSASREFPL